MINYKKILIFFFLILLSNNLWSNNKEFRYRTFFGRCPSKTVGTLAMNLIKTFDKSNSLGDIKRQLINDNLSKKYFIHSYKIKYDPLKKLMSLSFDCPEPLMKVQVYKENGDHYYSAILVETDEYYDPVYEILLRKDKKINYILPFLAIPVDGIGKEAQQKVVDIIKGLDKKLKKKISEVIINDYNELTIIVSIRGNPSSIFFGKDNWPNKIEKLKKIINYVDKNGKIPVVINFTNNDKVIVKFGNNS